MIVQDVFFNAEQLADLPNLGVGFREFVLHEAAEALRGVDAVVLVIPDEALKAQGQDPMAFMGSILTLKRGRKRFGVGRGLVI